ncbi:2-polyprenyl-6-methoxyphenol hydroxylase-like FAD-dependent oxidoreductase [Kribbella amoyensis]|uniref:2-polyprenyl-6-methoxyphenol hydroxylase-like FAD-dependent oxidoreductase n=1 Tax=Kribbella amoyensis TaxID=996641 RepID=A0A561BVF3_9ACTN|nr:NAD(P)/FAD-dependent oxidoreductase [Kribbella amoyensis]TWD82783.1 2-polyprenyl-6-methoxyphenol hydroxylase-like FAD-dependent oxidoreductase [Kribbella amoyensis]
MTITKRSEHEVVVVGARCAGAATAMLLGRMGHDVVVVDKARLPSDTLSTHGLVRGGVVQLDRWGLLDEVLAAGAPAIEKVRFDAAGQSITRRIKERAGVDILIAPRRYVLDELLYDAADRAGADLRNQVTATGLTRSTDGRVTGLTAHTASGDELELSARYVIGADGRSSRMAQYFGAPMTESFTPLSTVFYTYVEADGWDAFEFHVTHGAFVGVFPTNDGQACVWMCSPSTSPTDLRTAGSRRTAAFVEAIDRLAPELARRVRAGRIVAPIRGVANMPNYLRMPYGPGWALVGDAGYHRDPITGHGITDAFRDAELLATALDRALRNPAAEPDALATYHRTRDDQAREVFDLTRALTAFPPVEEFVALQIRLSEALEREADFLAGLPLVPGVAAAA